MTTATANRLADDLERDGLRLSLRVIEKMYAENPFWNERFGDAGRKHADTDAGRHIEHLVTSLRVDSPAVFLGYARWLQSVLTTRGMCTRHLADNFTLLAEEIARAGMDGSEAAALILTQSADSIARSSGAAGEVWLKRAAIVEQTVTKLFAQEPAWRGSTGTGRAGCVDDVDYFVVYLADALAHRSPSDFVEYTRLVGRIFEKRGLERVQLARLLGALRAAVSELCPEVAASYVNDALKSF